MSRFSNRTALVTGAGSGIGREFAIQLANQGCRLALCDINEDGLTQTQALLGPTVESSLHKVDVSNRTSMENLVEEVRGAHQQMHFLINNAGIASGGEFADQDLDSIDRIMGINVRGVLYGTKLFLPWLMEQDDAHIVNLSSMVGFMGLPGNAMYATTKFAIRGFSESLWAELAGTNVGLTVVHPGAIRTNIMKSADFTQESDKEKLVAMMDRFAMSPERAVRKILRAVEKRRMRQTICLESYALQGAARFAPRLTHALIYQAFKFRNRSA